MFKNIILGNDQYLNEIKTNKEKELEEEKLKMDRLIELTVKCDNMLKLLNRISEDINRVEREVQIMHKDANDKLIQICDIVDNIDDKL